MTYVRMADAAYAANIPGGYEIAAGYYGGPDEFRQWPAADWRRFPGFRLPIWVGGADSSTEVPAAIGALHALGVPRGSITVVDMEERRNPSYVQEFGDHLQAAGYLVWVYGSLSSVYGNPHLNGYWVADYTPNMNQIDAALQTAHVRAVQYAANVPPGFDASLVRAWTEGEMWHG